jgi:hypothetical protein
VGELRLAANFQPGWLLSSGQPAFFYLRSLFLIFDRDTEPDFFFPAFSHDTELKIFFPFFSPLGLTQVDIPHNIRAVQYGRSAFDGRREQAAPKICNHNFR